MPRNYVRKAPDRALITEEQINKAKELIEEGKSQRRAADEVGISESALRKRLKSTHVPTSLGRFKPTFTKDQEAEFAIHCKDLDDRFFGITINDLRRLAYEFATANNIPHRFDESCKMAGRDWVEGFLKRNERLSLRQSAPISLARAIGFNKTQVQRFYTILKEVYDKHNFRPNRIYNMDETGMSTVPKKTPKVVSVKGKKVVGKVVSAERGTTVTAIMCMSATGHYIPPAFIFPRKKVRPELLDGGPTQSVCMVSDSGYVNTKLFVDWLHHFKDFVHPSKEDPVLLIMDNHSSHISLEGTDYAREQHIVIVTLPPHGSHKLQPLDVALHGPLKTKYAIECEKWMNQHPGRGITQFQVASLFNKAFKYVATIGNAESGFRATGIFPFADDLFDEIEFAPSSVTDQYSNQPSTSVSPNILAPSSATDQHLNRPSTTASPNILALSPVTDQYLNLPSRTASPNILAPSPVTDEYLNLSSTPSSPNIFSIVYKEDSDSDATNVGSDIEDGKDNTELNKENICVDYDFEEKRTVVKPIKSSNEKSKASTPQIIPSNDTGSNKNDINVYQGSTAAQIVEKRMDSSNTKTNPSSPKTIAQLSPLPKMVGKKTRTRACLRSEIITSSPYKSQLEEKQKLEEDKRLKNSKNMHKRVVFESQPGPSGVKNKRKKLDKVQKDGRNNNKRVIKPQPASSGTNKKQNEKTPKQKTQVKRNSAISCPICGEKYEDPPTEDWIQCIICNDWFHEKCTAYESGIFKCDFCIA